MFGADGTEATIVETTPTIAAADALRIAVLERQVAILQSTLRDVPPPAISGSRISRIPVDADAQFISATEAGVAVIGADGTYVNIDPDTEEATDAEEVSESAARVLRTGTSVWVADFSGNQLIRLDPADGSLVSSIELQGPDGIQKDGRNLVVASARGGFVARVDPSDGAITHQADVGGTPTAVLVTEEGRIYTTVFSTGELVEIDSSDFSVIDRVEVGEGPVGLAYSADDVIYVANQTDGTVSRVDMQSGDVTHTDVGDGPVEVAVAFDSLWVSVSNSGDLVELDLDDLEIISRTPLGGSPSGLSVDAGSLWVAVADDMTVVRVER